MSYPRAPGRYTVDFSRGDLWLEVKGFFKASDRAKMLAVRAEHPEADIRFVFQTPYKTLNPSSMTTYAAWAEKHGFPWCAANDNDTLRRWTRDPR